MNSPLFPVSERRAVDRTAFAAVELSELEAVNGGSAVPTMTLTEYVKGIMSHVPPTNGNPDGYPDGCGNGIGGPRGPKG